MLIPAAGFGSKYFWQCAGQDVCREKSGLLSHFQDGVDRFAPEIIASLSCVVGKIYVWPEGSDLNALLIIFAIDVLIRLAWNVATLVHGVGHSLLSMVTDRKTDSIQLSSVLEGRDVSGFMASFLPGVPISIPFVGKPSSLWIEVGDRSPWKVRIKALGGPLFNLILLVISLNCGSEVNRFDNLRLGPGYGEFFFVQLLWCLIVGTNLYLVVISRTDWIAVWSGRCDRLYCGNFGFVGYRYVSEKYHDLSDRPCLLPTRVVNIFRTMGHSTEVRGAQAGGGLTIGKNRQGQPLFVGHKLVNSRRGNLTQALEQRFSKVRRRSIQNGVRPMSSSIMAAWHYRYGTSGPPSVLETHWHEWTPARVETVWQIENGQWTAQDRNINHRITHNGDFESWRLFNQEIGQAHLGLWLERVLHTPNQTVGDSPKIAGMMDLLITQGMWAASVRLAYQLTVAPSFAAAFGRQPPSKDAPHTAPSQGAIAAWAKTFESIFVAHIASLASPDELYVPEQLAELQREIQDALATHYQFGHLWRRNLIQFVHTAIHAFLHNDAYHAMQLFMAGAQGSFGLALLSTLEPEQLILSAWGQPLTVGFDPYYPYAIYASEPAAVDAVLAHRPKTYRLDLDQNGGEIAVLNSTAVTLYSILDRRELHKDEVESRYLSYQQNVALKTVAARTSENAAQDWVARDIQEIPYLLSTIHEDWLNSDSINRRSAAYFLDLLAAKAESLMATQHKFKILGLKQGCAQSASVDLLITGVENSLWLGARFAEDLKTIFPKLLIKTLSSNQMLYQLQHDPQGLELGPQSLVFAISQSGQTFSTRQVLHACEQWVRSEAIREFFVLTGEPTSLLGSSLAAPLTPGETFSRRIFTNGSGRRVAEPATAAVAATHQTLTELLFYIVRQMQSAFPQHPPFGMTLSLEGLLVLERMGNEVVHYSTPEVLGVSTEGQRQQTRLHRQLLTGAKTWAQHITEAPFAWALQALYVLITVGWVIPFGHTIPLAQTLFKGMIAVLHLPSSAFVTVLMQGLTVVDIGIYIFGAWFWTLGLRLIQRRQLLARTGKRTVVIGDDPWVHRLLSTYVSKLFSLSYGITSVDVHGADPQDHLLHRFGHRVIRGTLLFLGIPDGRCSQLQQAEEEAVVMTAKQASGIQYLGTGPEIFALGSNPSITNLGFSKALILPSPTHSACEGSEQPPLTDPTIEKLRESRFGSFQRLLASYLFFWALAKRVAAFPLLKYPLWRSQSSTKVMTTASPISASHLHPQIPKIQTEILPQANSSVRNR